MTAPAPKSPRRRRLVLVGLALGLAAVGAAGFLGWRAHERAAIVRSAVPPRPDLRRFSSDLVDRVSAAERAARDGSLPALRELAALYQINGAVAEAGQLLQYLIVLEPREARWPHRFASIRAGYGELEAAIRWWEQTIRLAPGYVPARIRLGDAFLKLNRDAEAAAAYAAVLQPEPKNPYALVGLARLDLKAGQPVRARERLEQAAEQSGAAIGTDLLVTVYEQLGERDRAAALRSRSKSAGTYYDPPDAWMDEMLDDCYDIFRLTLAAGFADHRGDAATSRRILERATQLAPKDGHVLLQLGMLCARTRDAAVARQYLERAAEVDPTLPDVWAQLIELYASNGDNQAAARALASGLRHCPNSPGLHLERGRRLAAAGQWDAALAEFQQTFRLRPDEADPLIESAQIYLRHDRTADGIAQLRRALEVEPEHPVALTTLALYAISTGDERAARDWLRRAGLQVRVSRETLGQLTAQYMKRFGRAYVAEGRE